MTSSDGNIAYIKDALARDAAALGEDLFGKPSFRSRNEIRWGSKGSRAITLTGRRKGSYRDFEAGRTGSMLDAIQDARGLPYTAKQVEQVAGTRRHRRACQQVDMLWPDHPPGPWCHFIESDVAQ